MNDSTQRLFNDILTYESKSDKKIPLSHYYIVYVIIDKKINASDYAKKVLKLDEDENTPLAIYVYYNELYLLYSSVEKGSHYLNGSHHMICSEFSSKLTMEYQCIVRCSIIELDTRTKVFAYFQYKIFENTKKSMVAKSKKKITKKSVDTYTLQECIELLKKKGIEWDEIRSSDRYGIFYKFMRHKNKFSTLSELFNPTNLEKYIDYLFS